MRLDRNRKKWVAAIAVLMATTFIAVPGWAEHGRRDHHERRYDGHHEGRHYRDGGRRHHDGDRYERRHHHRRHHARHHRRHHRYYEHAYRPYPVYHHAYANPRYYCAACHHRYDSYDALSDHVHRHHHIALIRIPFLIVQGVLDGIFGFTYYGY